MACLQIIIVNYYGFKFTYSILGYFTSCEFQEVLYRIYGIRCVDKLFLFSCGSSIPCYELKCSDEKGREVKIYINADTGREEQILILMIDENGTLTI